MHIYIAGIALKPGCIHVQKWKISKLVNGKGTNLNGKGTCLSMSQTLKLMVVHIFLTLRVIP